MFSKHDVLINIDIYVQKIVHNYESAKGVIGFGLVGAERRRRRGRGHRQGERGGRLGNRLEQPAHAFARDQRGLLAGSYGAITNALFSCSNKLVQLILKTLKYISSLMHLLFIRKRVRSLK